MRNQIAMRGGSLAVAGALLLCLLSGCGSTAQAEPDAQPVYADSTASEALTLGENEVPFSNAPISTVLMPVASGTNALVGSKSVIDASNTKDGYVMVKFTGTGTAKLKVLVTGPSSVRYTYNLSASGEYEVFPLSDGSGSYTVGVYQNTSGTKYAALQSVKLTVTLTDEFAPFLLPNQYVNYTADSQAVKLAATLTAKCSTDLEKVSVIYDYVISNLTYYKERAATVQSGYLPDIDAVLAEKKGICFDYAALMTAMLRSQGVPAKLVVGYAGTAYHAWISTYSDSTGWVDGVIYFDGSTWKRMDPTFASSASSSSSIMTYIGDGSNYTEKYLY